MAQYLENGVIYMMSPSAHRLIAMAYLKPGQHDLFLNVLRLRQRKQPLLPTLTSQS